MMRNTLSLAVAVAAAFCGSAALAEHLDVTTESTVITAPETTTVIEAPAVIKSTEVKTVTPVVTKTTVVAPTTQVITQAAVITPATPVSARIVPNNPMVHLDVFGLRLFGFGSVEPDHDMRHP